MKHMILGLMALTSISAFADTCSVADFSCPQKGFISEAQALGRVCLALKKAGLSSEGTISSRKHLKFLGELKSSVNDCQKFDVNGNAAAYFDLNLVEESYSGSWTAIEMAKDVSRNQRQVYR